MMENQYHDQSDNNQLVIAVPATDTNNQVKESTVDHGHQNVTVHVTAAIKKRKGNQFFQVAMFMLRGRSAAGKKSNKKDSPIPASVVEAVDSSKSTWKRLVGSMRPLHLQSPSTNGKPPSIFEIAAPSTPTTPVSTTEGGGYYKEVLPPPMSPAPATGLMSHSSSEDSMSSRYASAVNLQELDRGDEQDIDQDKGKQLASAATNDINGDDDQIDAKAEEFIAQFYKQMKLQRDDSIYD